MHSFNDEGPNSYDQNPNHLMQDDFENGGPGSSDKVVNRLL
jgi:hypothetical protein